MPFEAASAKNGPRPPNARGKSRHTVARYRRRAIKPSCLSLAPAISPLFLMFLMFLISSFTLCGAATPSALSRAVARRAQRAGLPVSPAPTQYLDVGYSLLDIGYSIALSRFNCVCVSGNVLASFFPESAWSRQVPLGMFCGAGRHFPIRDIAFERLTGGVKGGRGTK